MNTKHWLRRLAVVAQGALLVACTASDELPDPYEKRQCPGNQVLVCIGGRVPQGARISDREPRICQCRPPDQLY